MHHHVKRQINSYRYAAKGVQYTLTTQVNIWIQLLATIIVLIAAFLLDFSLEQYLILVLTIGFVISTELVNTAIEVMIDLLSPQQQEKAGVVKDVAAGAVLVASVTAAVIGITLFTYAFWAKFGLTGMSFSEIINSF